MSVLNIETTQRILPIVKCAGGKRQLLHEILPLIPSDFSTFVEPFLGGGAVLLALQPPKAIAADLNQDLILVYRMVQTDPGALLARLRQHPNSLDHYTAIRNLDRDPVAFAQLSDLDRAARFIYLNKTGFNGLHRVNRKGLNNVPFGHYLNPNITNEVGIYALHEYLRRADITFAAQDFSATLQHLPRDAFVYLDPPYAPLSKTSNFTTYTAGGFTAADQLRLRKSCDALTLQSVRFLLSNSDTPQIRDLFAGYHIRHVEARRSISSNPAKRGPVGELLIKNY